MVTKLSQLADLVEDDSLPSWLKIEIERRQEEILRALKETGVFEVVSPSGEKIRIELGTEEQDKTTAA